MRSIISAALGVALLSGVLTFAACSRGDQSRAANPTPAAELQLDDMIITAAELPGCELQREGTTVVATYNRAFTCGERLLTVNVRLEETREKAEEWVYRRWSTMDNARDAIAPLIEIRPSNPASLQITNVIDQFGRTGAPVEYVYCARWTDTSGTIPVTEYYGVFQIDQVYVEYTTFSTLGDGCGDSDSRELARTAAQRQYAKLKQIVTQQRR
jgi:hypothetical protein